MNLPYTMTPGEAADCVNAFKPKVVYPYHYMGQKPEEFAAALKGEPIEVRILNWYPEREVRRHRSGLYAADCQRGRRRRRGAWPD